MGKDDRRHIGSGEILFQPIDIPFQEREALVPVVLHARLPEHQMKAVHIEVSPASEVPSSSSPSARLINS